MRLIEANDPTKTPVHVPWDHALRGLASGLYLPLETKQPGGEPPADAPEPAPAPQETQPVPQPDAAAGTA